MVFNYIIIEWTPVTPSEEIGVLLSTMATLPTFMTLGLYPALANTNMTGTIWVALRMDDTCRQCCCHRHLPQKHYQ